MAKVVRDKEMTVSRKALYQAITEFEKYPEFLTEVVSAKIVSGAGTSKVKVKFEIEVVKRFEYHLEFTLKPESEVSWTLAESNFFKTNEGKWTLAEAGKGCNVHYELEVAFGFLVPGWVTKKLTEVNLPQMFEKFESQAKKNV